MTSQKDITGSLFKDVKSAALILASCNGRKEIVEYLLEKGADIEAKDSNGSTPLMIASRSGRKEIVEFLLESGADIEAKNYTGNTSLLLATLYRHPEVVKILLAAGADISAANYSGNKAIHFAFSTEIVIIFIEYGADIDAKGFYNKTLLEKLRDEFNKPREVLDLINFLVQDCGANRN